MTVFIEKKDFYASSVMGHSDVGVTLNVYTHASYDRAAEQMAKILDLIEQREKQIVCKYV